jgi:universal stress protein A
MADYKRILVAVDLTEQSDRVVNSARKERLGLGQVERRVENGTIKSEVVRVASEMDADLVVLGSRERHGVAVLLNLTEDTILHTAPCDVLAVRITT